MERPNKVLIIGAGPAGLTAAVELCVNNKYQVFVLEKADKVGGISRTEVYKDYRFDIGGHRFFTKDKKIEQKWHEALGDDLITVSRLSRIYHNNNYLAYPLKPLDTILHLGVKESFIVFFSYLRAALLPIRRKRPLRNGLPIDSEHVFIISFSRNIQRRSGGTCSEIQADWAAQRIKDISFFTILSNALWKRSNSRSLIEAFYYPRLGSGMMWEVFQHKVESQGGRVQLNSRVTSLRHENSRLSAIEYVKDGQTIELMVGHVISSMPLNHLSQLLDPPPPPEILNAANRLAYRAFIIVILVVDQKDVFPDQWLYINSPSVLVGRIQNFKNWSEDLVPDNDETSLGMEYFCNEGDNVWNLTDEQLTNLASAELKRLNIVTTANVIASHVVRQPNAYPLYNRNFQANVKIIKDYLVKFENLQTIGRGGMHRYNNMDHSMMTGIKAAGNVMGECNDLWDINKKYEYLEDIKDNSYNESISYKMFFRYKKLSAVILGLSGAIMLYFIF